MSSQGVTKANQLVCKSDNGLGGGHEHNPEPRREVRASVCVKITTMLLFDACNEGPTWTLHTTSA